MEIEEARVPKKKERRKLSDLKAGSAETTMARVGRGDGAQWDRTVKNRDVSTGPLTHMFVRFLALFTHSLDPHCLFRSRAPPRPAVLIGSLARLFAHSRTRGKANH